MKRRTVSCSHHFCQLEHCDAVFLSFELACAGLLGSGIRRMSPTAVFLEFDCVLHCGGSCGIEGGRFCGMSGRQTAAVVRLAVIFVTSLCLDVICFGQTD